MMFDKLKVFSIMQTMVLLHKFTNFQLYKSIFNSPGFSYNIEFENYLVAISIVYFYKRSNVKYSYGYSIDQTAYECYWANHIIRQSFT